jgi:hypothetical protein
LPQLSREDGQDLGDVFLNVNDPFSQWDWCRADELVVNTASEDEDFKRTRVFLQPFSELVVALGGSRVTSVARSQVSGSFNADNLRSNLSEMRKLSQGLDVHLVDSSNEKHPAHRAILGAASPYFRLYFYGSGMRESQVLATTLDPLQVDMQEYYPDAVKCMLGTFSTIIFWHQIS